ALGGGDEDQPSVLAVHVGDGRHDLSGVEVEDGDGAVVDEDAGGGGDLAGAEAAGQQRGIGQAGHVGVGELDPGPEGADGDEVVTGGRGQGVVGGGQRHGRAGGGQGDGGAVAGGHRDEQEGAVEGGV